MLEVSMFKSANKLADDARFWLPDINGVVKVMLTLDLKQDTITLIKWRVNSQQNDVIHFTTQDVFGLESPSSTMSLKRENLLEAAQLYTGVVYSSEGLQEKMYKKCTIKSNIEG